MELVAAEEEKERGSPSSNSSTKNTETASSSGENPFYMKSDTFYTYFCFNWSSSFNASVYKQLCLVFSDGLLLGCYFCN